MGGSGGGYFEQESPESVRAALRKEEETTQNQIFETQVSKDIADILTEYNSRDAAAVKDALQKLKGALESDLEEGTITPVFGGSVRKHTYVNGISDVDSLFVLKGEGLAELSPREALDLLEAKVRTALPGADVQGDRMSLRIQHQGLTLDLLPAVRRAGRLCIPSESGGDWSGINPEAFLRKLSEVNRLCGEKVVPTIKIMKGINESFPEARRLSGYHIESLAIEAFRGYTGPQNTKAMVEHLIGFSSERVLSPIRDKTGQSLHVDEYAGSRGSERRRLMAQSLDRVWRRIKNANGAHSRDKWLEILDPE